MCSAKWSTLALVAVLILSCDVLAEPRESAMPQHTLYRSVKVDGVSIFYREAGPKDAPTILLLHGLPSSSRMFEPLLRGWAGSFTWSRPIIRDSGIAMRRRRRSLRIRSIISRR